MTFSREILKRTRAILVVIEMAKGRTVVYVSGQLKQQGYVFIVVVNTKTETLMPVITRKIKPDNWVYTDTYKSYAALDMSELTIQRFLLSHQRH